MPSPEFQETVGGRRFLEGTMPEIARQLKRIADALEKANVQESQRRPTVGGTRHPFGKTTPGDPVPAVVTTELASGLAVVVD